MKVTRLVLSLCYTFYAFVLFYTVNGFHEYVYHLLEGNPLPLIAMIFQMFDTIGLLLFVYPVLIGFACWRCLECARPTFQLVLVHFLLVGFMGVIFGIVLLALATVPHMPGFHPVTGFRVVGNILIGTGILAIIVRSYLQAKNTEQGDGGKRDK